MKKVISSQAVMDNGKTTFSGLFTSEGVPVEVELICEDGIALMSIYSLEKDKVEHTGRPLTDDEIEAVCRNYENCNVCPLYNYCDEEMM